MLPLTVPEVRRLLVALIWPTRTQPAWYWPGHDGDAATRPAPDAHTINDASDKCGWSSRHCRNRPAAGGGHQDPGNRGELASHQPMATARTSRAASQADASS
jgi:hypothetical protein